jgi:hypothetical protein
MHFLGEVIDGDTPVFAVDDALGGAWEVVEVNEVDGNVVLKLGRTRGGLRRVEAAPRLPRAARSREASKAL